MKKTTEIAGAVAEDTWIDHVHGVMLVQRSEGLYSYHKFEDFFPDGVPLDVKGNWTVTVEYEPDHDALTRRVNAIYAELIALREQVEAIAEIRRGLVGKHTDAADSLVEAESELLEAIAKLETELKKGEPNQ